MTTISDVRATYEHPRLGEQEVPQGLLDLLASRRLFTDMDWFAVGTDWAGREVESLGEAQLAASVRRWTRAHALMLDIDHEVTVDGRRCTVYLADERGMRRFWLPPHRGAWVVPSTNVGKHHLYVDCDLTWYDVSRILESLERSQVLEPGYVGASLAREATSLRLPWVAKEPGHPSSKGGAS